MFSQFWQSVCVSAENTWESPRTQSAQRHSANLALVSQMGSINPLLNVLAHVLNKFSPMPSDLSHGYDPLNDLSLYPFPSLA